MLLLLVLLAHFLHWLENKAGGTSDAAQPPPCPAGFSLRFYQLSSKINFHAIVLN
jgi:hypothetical protein